MKILYTVVSKNGTLNKLESLIIVISSSLKNLMGYKSFCQGRKLSQKFKNSQTATKKI